MVHPPRFLVVTYPAQGHINPALHFSKRLIAFGAEVIYFTSLSAYRSMFTQPSSSGNMHFSSFSDGYDDGFKPGVDLDHYLSEMRRCGSQALSDLIVSGEKEGRPFTFLVYTFLVPWASKTANELQLPSSLLWIQAATVFDIYYYYLHVHGDIFSKYSISADPSSTSIQLPGLPLKFTIRDLPSFMDSANTYSFAMPIFKEVFEMLEEEENPKVLVNTFDDLESEALKAISKFDLIGIGPLIPLAFLEGKDPSNTPNDHYIEWLNLKPERSVIYVSFGSISVLSKPQMEEIGRALLDCGRPFLWVVTAKQNPEERKEENRLSCMEELEKLGMIVTWCSQMEVLSHPSLGCFVSHCGWNSTLESLVSGVPMVAFPQWTDQGTNAKLIEEAWKSGLRVRANEEGVVQGVELRRCLELVMEDGEKGEEMRRNAKKWKDLGREAAIQGGSSNKYLKAFLDEAIQDKTGL
ncbi:hypothetical protein FNV43_RR01329 [Rhamnella rubrinervis]|uniref:Glycosyltransferase n=1 Tax=Rhamnella rubrinervis TaxID=2594499 RepID=A0A8K0HS36_9ROSA|nr:hypothetical protein FNV43_RR01329 [Rhamnella rubrinervis]